MRRHLQLASLLLALSLPLDIYAEDAVTRFATADRTLNQTYGKVVKGLPPAASSALRGAQKAWIEYRDANAALAGAREPSNPEAATLKKASLTTERDGFLHQYYIRGHVFDRDASLGELADADRQLNESYDKAREIISSDVAQALKRVQQAWVVSRDGDVSALRSIGAIKSEGVARFYLRAETSRRISAIQAIRAARIANDPTPPSSLVGVRLQAQSKGRSFTAGRPERTRPVDVAARIDSAESIVDVILDMREKLLATLTGSTIEFWDVQTGGLIRSVLLNQPGEEIEVAGQELINAGGGRVAVIVNFDRERQCALRLYDRSSDSFGKLDSSPDSSSRARFALSEDAGRFAVLGASDLKDGLWEDQELLVGSWIEDSRSLTIPVERQEMWDFVSLSLDGSKVAVATKNRVLMIALPDGKVVQDFRIKDGHRVVAMHADSTPTGVLVCTESGEILRLNPPEQLFESNGRLSAVPGSTLTALNVEFTCTKAGWQVAGSWATKNQVAASANAPQALHNLLPSLQLCAVDREGEFAMLRAKSGSVQLYHLPTGNLVRAFGEAKAEGTLVQLSGDGKTLLYCQKGSADTVVNTLALDRVQHSSIAVRCFDQLVGIDRSATSLIAYREPNQKFQARFHSSPRLSSSPNSVGVVDLRTGRSVDRRLDERLSWHFSPVTGSMIGLGENGGRVAAFTLDPWGHGDPRGRQISVDALLKRDRIDFQSLSLSADFQRLAFVDRELDSLVIADVANPVRPSTTHRVELDAPHETTSRSAETLFSHDGGLLAVLRSGKFATNIAVYETQSGKMRWSHDFEIVDNPTFSGDGRFFIFSERRREAAGVPLYVLNALTGEVVSKLNVEAVPGSDTTVIASDGSRALLASGAGGYRIIDIVDGKAAEVARFVPGTGGSYAIILPDGHYLASGDAYRLISFGSGGRSQLAESMDVKYNRPDLVARALGANPELVQAFRRAREKRLARLGIDEAALSADSKPPVVALDYSKIPPATSGPILKLPIDVRPGAAPLAALEVTVNDVPVLGRDGRALAGAQAKGFAGDLDIELASGTNKITVWARDAKGFTSSRVSVNVALTAKPKKPPVLYVLAVGINKYLGTIPPLTLAEKDAIDIIDVFARNALPTFSEAKTKLLPNTEATRAAILEARSFFAEAGVDDQVVIFLSGHGVLDAEYEYRFCSADTDLKRLPETTLTFGEIESLLDGCRARKRIMMLDTCHAGEPDRDDPRLADVRVPATTGVRSIPFQPVMAPGVSPAGHAITDLLERHFVDLRIGAGAAVLSSSTAQQQSLEAAEVKNGLFTAAVLTGLRQRKADLNSDGTVRVSELLRYCQEEVRRLSGGRQEPVSRHVNLAEDFSVVTYQ